MKYYRKIKLHFDKTIKSFPNFVFFILTTNVFIHVTFWAAPLLSRILYGIVITLIMKSAKHKLRNSAHRDHCRLIFTARMDLAIRPLNNTPEIHITAKMAMTNTLPYGFDGLMVIATLVVLFVCRMVSD